MTVKIAFINKARTPFEPSMSKLVSACQKFLDECFVPVWGYPAILRATKRPRKDEWQMLFVDDADEADSLGYHDLTVNGRPVSKVFVKTTIASGQQVSTCACHELCEMLIDPLCNLWALNEDTNTMHAYEMCDAVEDYEFEVDGVMMSDFVHPGFFETTGKKKFDWLGKVDKPFQTKAGYQIVVKNGEMKEVFSSAPKRARFRREDRQGHRSEFRKWRSHFPPQLRRPR